LTPSTLKEINLVLYKFIFEFIIYIYIYKKKKNSGRKAARNWNDRPELIASIFHSNRVLSKGREWTKQFQIVLEKFQFLQELIRESLSSYNHRERERERDFWLSIEAAPVFLSKNLSTFPFFLPLSHFHSIDIYKSWVLIAFPKRKDRSDLFGYGMCR